MTNEAAVEAVQALCKEGTLKIVKLDHVPDKYVATTDAAESLKGFGVDSLQMSKADAEGWRRSGYNLGALTCVIYKPDLTAALGTDKDLERATKDIQEMQKATAQSLRR